MAYDIIIGRDKSDKAKFGSKGLINIGKGYVKMGNYTSLSNRIWMDVARSHVILVAGKRGGGKSYSLSVIAEELSCLPQEEAKNISSLIFDTMGIFWTMKYENEKDSELLKEWGLEPKKLPVKVFIPFGKAQEYEKKLIPFDETFALKSSELNPEDWITIFKLELTSLVGVLIERVINKLKISEGSFTIKDIQEEIEKDSKANKESKEIAFSLFGAADSWGVFSKTLEGTQVTDLITPGTTNILDISVYSSISAFNIRALVISLVSRKLFTERMDARKKEELESLRHGQDYLSYKSTREIPLLWLFIDEVHEFLNKEEKTPATDALIQLLREGRQPGISLVMATQQPGKLHSDALSQADIVISHRVTAKPDVEALNEIMQTYLLQSIKKAIDDLPSLKGSAIILDDNSERLYPIRIRPKFTWHGGEAPAAVRIETQL
ncbi:ATP-binding protein [Candidatus Pacearchaeota archaeon]|nr:ATP-binding protein [Candidatus Pacearchaeota archaeon]